MSASPQPLFAVGWDGTAFTQTYDFSLLLASSSLCRTSLLFTSAASKQNKKKNQKKKKNKLIKTKRKPQKPSTKNKQQKERKSRIRNDKNQITAKYLINFGSFFSSFLPQMDFLPPFLHLRTIYRQFPWISGFL